MSDYWLISNEDVGEVVTALEDARRHASREGQRAYFDGVLHTLHSGLHTTDAIPTDFQPVVTVHADPSMTPSTAAALGEMIGLVTAMIDKPRCPSCGSWTVIEPTEKWPAYTCDPCGHDFQWKPSFAMAPEARDGE